MPRRSIATGSSASAARSFATAPSRRHPAWNFPSRNHPRELDMPARFGKRADLTGPCYSCFRDDAGPAGDGAADRAPAPEPLVDLGGDLLLLLQRALGLDLRVGDVADREPARRLVAHVV